jgi:circadian clock protein KaiB
MSSDTVPAAELTRGVPHTDDFVLRLYVTGATSRSARAIANARRIFDTHLAGRYDLQIVDIYQEPLKAKEHQIVAAPTLVKVSPAPSRRVIGDLSDETRLLKAFGLIVPDASDGTI